MISFFFFSLSLIYRLVNLGLWYWQGVLWGQEVHCQGQRHNSHSFYSVSFMSGCLPAAVLAKSAKRTRSPLPGTTSQLAQFSQFYIYLLYYFFYHITYLLFGGTRGRLGSHRSYNVSRICCVLRVMILAKRSLRKSISTDRRIDTTHTVLPVYVLHQIVYLGLWCWQWVPWGLVS